MKVSDSLSQMQNPARRAAYTQALFGRSSQALTPLLYKGSGAIQEQLDLAKKYGDYIDGDGVGAVKQMAADQREMGFAMDGVKIQLGKALLPVMLALSKVLLSITQALQPIITNSTVLKITLGVLAAAFLAWKVVALASAIANYGLATSMTAALGPIALVIAGIAALIIIGYELYKHWDDISKLAGVVWGAIKDAASAAIDWLKKNWPLILVILTGPFGLAVAAIVTHWDKIKQATTAAWDKVKSLITGALTTIKSAITTFTTWMSTAWDKVKTTLTTVAGWFDKPAQAAQDAYNAVKKWIEKIPDAISARHPEGEDGGDRHRERDQAADQQRHRRLERPGVHAAEGQHPVREDPARRQGRRWLVRRPVVRVPAHPPARHWRRLQRADARDGRGRARPRDRDPGGAAPLDRRADDPPGSRLHRGHRTPCSSSGSRPSTSTTRRPPP